MNGEYEEIVVWNRPLSESEVDDYFNQNQSMRAVCPNEPAICRDRVAQYTFEDTLADDAVSTPGQRGGSDPRDIFTDSKFDRGIRWVMWMYGYCF